MACVQASQTLYCLPLQDAISRGGKSSGAVLQSPFRQMSGIAASFARGSPILWRTCQQRKRTYSVSIKCEKNTKGGNSLDIWLSRLAMVGFAAALSVEVATGKGLLENLGLVTPMPAVSLPLTALVGVLAAVFIFQSASRKS